MAHLFVLSGDDIGQSFDVGDQPVVLGRVRDVDCTVRGASVSRRHAQLSREGELWVLEDLGSSNGIALGRKRAKRLVLSDGDVFKLGDVELRFRLDAPEAGVKPPAPAPGPALERPTDSKTDAESDRATLRTPEPASGTAADDIELEITAGGGSSSIASTAPGDELELEGDLELEGEWSAGAAPPVAPVSPASSAPSGPAPEVAPPRAPAGRGRSAGDAAAARAKALGAVGGERATTSGRPILQFSQVENRGGFLNADLDQQPFWLRSLIYAGLALLVGGIIYGSYRLTQSLRDKPSAIVADDEPGD